MSDPIPSHNAPTLPPAPPSPVDPEAETVAPPSPASATATLPPVPAGVAPAACDGISIPGYEILSVLGRGGMGVVYQARQTKLGRVVALKMILSGVHAGEADLARFRTEGEAIARLQHPNIVQVFEVGEQGGLPYFSLEFCGGGSLERKLNGTPLPPKEAAALVETLARAMAAAHQKGVIHRDLKPANVLLAEDGTPKIADFGLAKKLDEAGQTASGAIMGTPSYMAPEQAGGKADAIGPAADVYALGAILYECLTGRPPFKAATALDTIVQVVADEPVSPGSLNAKVPHDLETVCLNCLQKEPHKRYGSATELAEDLRRFRVGEPIRARPVGAFEQATKWARRRPAAAALLAVTVSAALLLLVGGLYFTARLRHERDRAINQERIARTEKSAAERAQERAEAEEARATRQLDRARRTLMTSQLLRVAAVCGRDAAQGRELLEDTNACPLDLRDFTWGFHYRLCCHDTTAGGQERVTLKGHRGFVSSVAFTADGMTLVSAGGGRDPKTNEAFGELKLWDMATGRERVTLAIPGEAVLAAACSPDGTTLASGGFGGAVRLWDMAAGKEKATLPVHSGPVFSVAFSADGKTLAAGCFGGVTLWDVATGVERATLKCPPSARITSVAFTPDGLTLASGVADRGPGEVRLWDVGTGKERAVLKGHTGDVMSVAFAPDGKTLASGGSAGFDMAAGKPLGEVKLWDVAAARERVALQGHTGNVTSVAFTPDGQTLASGASLQGAARDAGRELAGEIKLWDLVTGQERATLRGHSTGVTCVAFAPDGKVLASGSADQAVKLWEATRATWLASLTDHAGVVHAVAFAPDGKTLASASGRYHMRDGSPVAGRVTLWDVRTGQVWATLCGHSSVVTCVAFTPDGKVLASGSEDHTVRLWDSATGQERATLEHPGPVTSLAFAPDGRTLAVANVLEGSKQPGEVRVWDVGTRQEQLTLKGHAGSIRSVVFAPDGRTLAGGSDDATVILWDVPSGLERDILKGHGSAVTSVAFTADGKTLASGSQDAVVKLWDAATGEERAALGGHDDAVASIAFMPDGRTLIAGDVAGTVALWDVSTGRKELTLEGHVFRVNSLALAPDGNTLASGGGFNNTGELKLWDTAKLPEQKPVK